MRTSSLKVRTLGSTSETAPVVVVLHGFGAPGDDLVPIAQWLASRTPFRYVVAEAPLALPQGGRAWWHIDFAAREARLRRGEGLDLREEAPEGLPEARAQVEALLDSLDRQNTPIALVGFSQGAMLSMDTALHRRTGVRCLGLLSGTFLNAADWTPRLSSRRHIPVFMSHGRRDAVLPFALSDELRATLTQQGFDVRFHAFEGGHEIPRSAAEELAEFLRVCLAPA